MNKKGQIGTQLIVGLAVMSLIAIVLTGLVQQTLEPAVNTQSVIDDGITAVLGDCAVYTDFVNFDSNGSVFFANGSGAGVLAEGTDYIICNRETGLVSGITDEFQGALNANYSYRADGYITSAGTRAIVNLIPLGIGLAVLLAGFALAGLVGRGS